MTTNTGMNREELNEFIGEFHRTMITRSEMEQVSEKAAEKALHRVFMMLGVDTDSPQSVLRLQSDLRRLSAWGEAQEVVKTAGIKAAITIIVTSFLAAMWIGIRAKMGLPLI